MDSSIDSPLLLRLCGCLRQQAAGLLVIRVELDRFLKAGNTVLHPALL